MSTALAAATQNPCIKPYRDFHVAYYCSSKLEACGRAEKIKPRPSLHFFLCPLAVRFAELGRITNGTVKTLYNDTVFYAVRIVIPKVSLFSDFVRKTHQTSKLCNDIAYLRAQSQN